MVAAKAHGLAGKRFLIAKPGLDGHDVGAKIIALALRDAGAEVIYTGLRKTPEYIARVAIEEDVDAVGLSILSGSHLALVEETLNQLRRSDGGDIRMFVGGTIPADDRDKLVEMGVCGVFGATCSIEEMLGRIAEQLA